jgi:hypothetical protein
VINFTDPALGAINTDDTLAMTRLHDQLVASAEAEQLLDVAYRTIDSPVGPLLLAATDQGLVRVAYEREGHECRATGCCAATGRWATMSVAFRPKRLCSRSSPAGQSTEIHCRAKRLAPEHYRR